MRLCILCEPDPASPSGVSVAEMALVGDDHEFGWRDGQLHYEGAFGRHLVRRDPPGHATGIPVGPGSLNAIPGGG